MQHNKNSFNTKKTLGRFPGIWMRYIKYLPIVILLLGITDCTDFVEVDPPKNKLIAGTVFNDPETVESALANVYYKMREQGMVSGNLGLSVLMGLYSDELDYYGFNTSHLELYNHQVKASNTIMSSWWSDAYNLIYAANDIIQGIQNSNGLSMDDQARFKGQALFVRAYMHGLLANIYGDIPYITTTDYLKNNSVGREPLTTVYGNIISDLTDSVNLLDNTDPTGNHVVPDQSTAKALLARMYLYTENWTLAETTSSEVIDTHDLEPDINKVFLKNSAETLWQFKPNGITYMNTYEANQLIIRFIPGQTYALTNNLMEAFEPGDLRLSNWVGSLTSSDGATTLNFAYKYKALFNEPASLEYSIIFRLSEQYLIRAEARAHLGDLLGAQEDLNAIRNRAGLENTTANTLNGLLVAILQERRVELFTEQGHRWFDLNRTDKAGEIMSPLKSNWSVNDVWLPIPETELEINPNLKPQNPGY